MLNSHFAYDAGKSTMPNVSHHGSITVYEMDGEYSVADGSWLCGVYSSKEAAILACSLSPNRLALMWKRRFDSWEKGNKKIPVTPLTLEEIQEGIDATKDFVCDYGVMCNKCDGEGATGDIGFCSRCFGTGNERKVGE